jgi:hypothetical protein
MTPQRTFPHRLVVSTAAVLVFGGCSDARELTRPLDPASASLAAGQPDPSMDQSNSYLYAELNVYSTATIYSDVAFVDPSTDQTVTSLTVEAPVQGMSTDFQRIVPDADSHDAAKKSDRAINAIGFVLRDLNATATPGSRFR